MEKKIKKLSLEVPAPENGVNDNHELLLKLIQNVMKRQLKLKVVPLKKQEKALDAVYQLCFGNWSASKGSEFFHDVFLQLHSMTAAILNKNAQERVEKIFQEKDSLFLLTKTYYVEWTAWRKATGPNQLGLLLRQMDKRIKFPGSVFKQVQASVNSWASIKLVFDAQNLCKTVNRLAADAWWKCPDMEKLVKGPLMESFLKAIEEYRENPDSISSFKHLRYAMAIFKCFAERKQEDENKVEQNWTECSFYKQEVEMRITLHFVDYFHYCRLPKMIESDNVLSFFKQLKELFVREFDLFNSQEKLSLPEKAVEHLLKNFFYRINLNSGPLYEKYIWPSFQEAINKSSDLVAKLYEFFVSIRPFSKPFEEGLLKAVKAKVFKMALANISFPPPPPITFGMTQKTIDANKKLLELQEEYVFSFVSNLCKQEQQIHVTVKQIFQDDVRFKEVALQAFTEALNDPVIPKEGGLSPATKVANLFSKYLIDRISQSMGDVLRSSRVGTPNTDLTFNIKQELTKVLRSIFKHLSIVSQKRFWQFYRAALYDRLHSITIPSQGVKELPKSEKELLLTLEKTWLSMFSELGTSAKDEIDMCLKVIEAYEHVDGLF